MNRVLFKGTTYRLLDVSKATKMLICNFVNKGMLDHMGSIQKHNLNLQMTVPHVYSLEDLLYAVTIIGCSQWVNKVWLMSSLDMAPRRAYPCKNPKKQCSGDMWIHRTKKEDVFTMDCNKCDYQYTIAKPKE